MGSTRGTLIASVAAALLGTILVVAGLGKLPAMSQSWGTTVAGPSGTVVVRVEQAQGPGTAPAREELAPRRPQAAALPNVEVRAIPTTGATEASAVARTDDAGLATLALPPGSYWVYVPLGAASGAIITPQLPSGLRVSGWNTVEVGADAATEVTIGLTIANP